MSNRFFANCRFYSAIGVFEQVGMNLARVDLKQDVFWTRSRLNFDYLYYSSIRLCRVYHLFVLMMVDWMNWLLQL